MLIEVTTLDIFEATTLDDLLMDVYKNLLISGVEERSTKGSYVERTGVLLKLDNPLARLSRSESKGTIFSCLGELAWYLSGSNCADFISYYIPMYKNFAEKDNTIYGAYGPRLKKKDGLHDQIENIISLLTIKPTSRQAVIQLFDARDISDSFKDIPCTISLQFLLRGGNLNLYTNMRSNDAYMGLPHDIFAFTMIQEIIAKSLGCQVGTYNHFVASLHLYIKDKDKARKFIDEGFQTSLSVMPPMPSEKIKEQINEFLIIEKKNKNGFSCNPGNISHCPLLVGFIEIIQKL